MNTVAMWERFLAEKTMSVLSTIFTVNQVMSLEGHGLFTKLTFDKYGKIIHCLHWALAGVQKYIH
jgi:hypothetical protein